MPETTPPAAPETTPAAPAPTPASSGWVDKALQAAQGKDLSDQDKDFVRDLVARRAGGDTSLSGMDLNRLKVIQGA